MSRRLLGFGALCVALAFAVVLAGAAVRGGTDRPHEVAVRDALLGAAAATQPVDFTLVLRLPRQRQLERFLHDIADPSSPRYRRFISATQFGKRFGLPAPALSRLRARLGRLGIDVTQSYPQRTTLDVHTTAATLRRVFGVRLLEYRDRLGRRFHAPASPGVIPHDLAAALTGVAGLNTRPVGRPLTSPVTSGFKPADLARAYDFDRLGASGRGQTIAVFSLFRFNDQDVEQFDGEVGISKPGVCSATVKTSCVAHVPVKVGTENGTTETDAEDALDVETIHGVAPDAVVLNFETPIDLSGAKTLTDFGHAFVSSIVAAVNQAVKDGRAQIMSISYGIADSATFGQANPVSSADRAAGESAFAAALAHGMNIFVSSGDQGAFECQRFDLSNHHPCVAWPNESPSVVSVGGTLLDVGTEGRYREEAGWQDTLSEWGGGGGLSEAFSRPSWQSSAVPGLQNRFSNGKRQTPDVSGAASGGSGTYVVFEGSGGSIGGTSASAPFWAGVTALIAEQAQKQNAGKLPAPLNPLLYKLAASKKQNLFHDVVRGGNRYYPATSGWDYATGLGSPNVANLTEAIIGSLKG
jgi:subtilase family serine protease